MLWRHVKWIHQKDVKYEDTSYKAHRWKLFEYFVTHFNDYRKKLFSPSDLICSDESISCSDGQGGHWINLGLPMYVEMERNLDNGVGAQNSEYGYSGIIMWLRIFKFVNNEEYPKEDEENILHGTKFLKELVMPWYNTERIVCKDLYFKSVHPDE